MSDNFLERGIGRRELLRVGLGGAAWLSAAARLLASEAERRPREPARSVILLWLQGGPSQLETFDPHPGARIAAGTRAIETAVKGIQLAEGLERVAEQMASISLVRSLVGKEGDHERGVYHLKTGYRPDPTVVHPSLGAIVCHELPAAGVEIPRHVSILPGRWPSRGGYLGAKYDAFQTGDPAGPVPDVTARVPPDRNRQRLRDLKIVESAFARGRSGQVERTRHLATVEAAQRMMTSEQIAAFDVGREPEAVRARYGDTPFGRGCLAARRLIEVGVRCVEVTLGGWDSHANNHEIQRENLKTLDPAFAALVADLRARGLLERTVVLCGGEFGRTPRVNALAGRDHWPHGFSFALAGGGIRGGRAIGQTDPEGGRKIVEPLAVADLHATALAALGIDPAQEIVAPVGRPIKLSEGRPIEKLLAG